MHSIYNSPLLTALISMILAQGIKVPLHLIVRGSWNPGLSFSTAKITKGETAEAHLKELLGHRPVEVLAGLVLGVAVSFGMYSLF